LRLKPFRYISEEDVDWTTLDGYFRRLDRQGISQNVVTLVGHGTIRTHVMGEDWKRTPTTTELEKMKELVKEAMMDGAAGLSTGLVYPPGSYADTQEIMELVKVATNYGGIYATHIREWGSQVLGWSEEKCTNLEGLSEAIEIGRESRVRTVVISHYNVRTEVIPDPEQYNKARGIIDSARDEGIDVRIDVLPDKGGVRPLHRGFLPPHYYEDGVEKMVNLLREPNYKSKIKEDLMKKKPFEIGFANLSRTLLLLKNGKGDCFTIFPPFESHLKNRTNEGKTLSEIAKRKGKDLYDTILDLIIEEEGEIYANVKTTDFHLQMSEFTWPSTMMGTDGGSNEPVGKHATQRANFLTGFGGFPTALTWVREEKVITLEEMVRRMTSMPASTLGLRDRGVIKEGFWADITIFDPDKVRNNCTLENDARPEYPSGIPYVFVNGELVVDENVHTGSLPGKVLRHYF
jgi:N-acyl-D-aspartate/D-glutamate deacylase